MNLPKVLLIILDGWGFRVSDKGNAIRMAKTPTFDYLWQNYPHTLLNAFGQNVGLPWGIIGSSEVGHTSIGSGKLLYQEIYKINDAIESGQFFSNQVLTETIKFAKNHNGSLHLIGMLSDAGVHSHQIHLYMLLEAIKRNKFNNPVFLHIITDGRDTAPKMAKEYIKQLQEKIRELGVNAQIATISGRYYAMDRNSEWSRTKKVFQAIVKKEGEFFQSPDEAIDRQYEKDISDEFIVPSIIKIEGAKNGYISKIFHKDDSHSDDFAGALKSGDGVILWNFRSERMRQITELLLFKRNDIATVPTSDIKVTTLTTYNDMLPVSVMFPEEKIPNPLAKILADQKITQGHFAETEKYAHVTYFFNGGNTKPFSGEEWYLVPSPRVDTYDHKPEMSANEITSEIFKRVKERKFDFILVNYANADMVGHTGSLDATIKAAETVDDQLKKLTEAFPETYILVTADHGNAECLINEATGEPDKKHTVNPVPFILIHPSYKATQDDKAPCQTTGILADIAPTILEIFGIEKTKEMTGTSLLGTLKSDPTVEKDEQIS